MEASANISRAYASAIRSFLQGTETGRVARRSQRRIPTSQELDMGS